MLQLSKDRCSNIMYCTLLNAVACDIKILTVESIYVNILIRLIERVNQWYALVCAVIYLFRYQLILNIYVFYSHKSAI